MISVRIPTTFRDLTSGKSEVRVEASTVRGAIDALEQACPGMRARMLGEDGTLRRYVNLFVNDEDVRGLGKLDAKLADGDRLQIVPAMAGG